MRYLILYDLWILPIQNSGTGPKDGAPETAVEAAAEDKGAGGAGGVQRGRGHEGAHVLLAVPLPQQGDRESGAQQTRILLDGGEDLCAPIKAGKESIECCSQHSTWKYR